MKTSDIFRECAALPGVTIKGTADCVELRMQRQDGNGLMSMYSLFPGILLGYIHVSSPVWPAPFFEHSTPDSTGPLLLNYCISGRCEILLNNNHYVYMKQGELSVTERYAQNQYVYPGNSYEGIEFFLDLETICTDAPYIQDAFLLPTGLLREKYCPQGQTYLAPCQPALENCFQALWKLYQNPSRAAAAERRAIFPALLGQLLYGEMPEPDTSHTFLTSAQAGIAKQTEQIIRSNLQEHRPAKDIAHQFGISETSLKNYFRGVYGQNISTYLLQLRMDEAARLLADGNTPVGKIAEQVGYLNQSKFAAAFKRCCGMSPMEYRRTKRLEQLEHL